ncbi:MAG: DUF5060 domain-containing protein [Bacteroidales bacterium]|nr:DUF5060 domain-containing protein [Bacteroidales bacterium]
MRKSNLFLSSILLLLTVPLALRCTRTSELAIDGEMKAWHTLTLTFAGPFASEYDTVNPFTNYRLDAEFSNGTEKYVVPGYFAADGNKE